MQTAQAGDTEFLVFLGEQADLSGAAALQTKAEKGAYVYQKLTEIAGKTQPPLLAALRRMGVEYRPFWVANMVWVRGDQALIQALAQRSEVAHLYANPHLRLELPEQPPVQPAAVEAPDTVEWNIQKIHADQVWALGYTGQGVVIGGQDTGYEWDHPALIRQYRGWDGVSADHNHNWHDAIHTGNGSPCPNDSPEPCDDIFSSHGTHTMGTMVGDDGEIHQIGVAPGARWIGCRNMDNGVGTPATYAECYQWFLAPSDLKGANQVPNWPRCDQQLVELPSSEAVIGILTRRRGGDARCRHPDVHSAGNPLRLLYGTPRCHLPGLLHCGMTTATITSPHSAAAGDRGWQQPAQARCIRARRGYQSSIKDGAAGGSSAPAWLHRTC
jgi:hypothetical protein